jgi:hypothetical protein
MFLWAGEAVFCGFKDGREGANIHATKVGGAEGAVGEIGPLAHQFGEGFRQLACDGLPIAGEASAFLA